MNKSLPQTPNQFIEIDLVKLIDYTKLSIISFIVILVLTIFFIFNISWRTIGISFGGFLATCLAIGSPFLIYKFSGSKNKTLFILLLLGVFSVASGIIYYLVKTTQFGNQQNYYESFENKTITLKDIQNKTQELQKALDSVELISEETCNVLNTIETKFMDNATVPQTDESNLSETTRERMKSKRIQKAKDDWKEKKVTFANQKKEYNKATIQECFINEKDEEYKQAVEELKDLLNSPTVINIESKLNSFNVTNDFSLMYANKFAEQASNVIPSGEGFQSELSNNPVELINKADKLIEKIKKTNESLEKTKKSTTVITNMTSNPNTIRNLVSN